MGASSGLPELKRGATMFRRPWAEAGCRSRKIRWKNMIRPFVSEDAPRILEIAASTGVFKPREMVDLENRLGEFASGQQAEDEYFVVWEQDDLVLGFVDFGVESFCEDLWFLWWIAVSKQSQGLGVGKSLSQYVESMAADRGARMVILETSSLPIYEPTRSFYVKQAYKAVATVPDFYSDGDDKIIYEKRLRPRAV